MPVHTRMLLGLRPDHALVRMLNDENAQNFPAGLFKFGMPEVVGTADPTLTRIQMTADRLDVQDNTMLPYVGGFSFRYHRVDLTDQFIAILNGFRPPLPTSTQVLLDEITRITNIEFFKEDIVLEEITRHNAFPYVIKAKVESLRFVGQIEVEMIDLENLTTYLETGLSAATYNFSTEPQLRSTDIYAPFINATPLIGQSILREFEDRSWSVDFNKLGVLLGKTVPTPGKRIDQNPGITWVNSQTPAAWNFNGAEVTVLSDQPQSTHMYLPRLDKLILIELDADKITTLDDPLIQIPYYRYNENESDFQTNSRIRYSSMFSLTNATAWNKELVTLEVGDVLAPPDVNIFNFEIVPGEVWNFWPEANPLNLNNSVVQHNGEIQRFMPQPMDTSLNRVLIVTFSDLNTVYNGNFPIFYRAPIYLNNVVPDVTEGDAIDHDFAPDEGEGPYVVSLNTGSFAPGHSIVNNHLVGTSSTAGVYSGEVVVEDASGTVVPYSFNYRVVEN